MDSESLSNKNKRLLKQLQLIKETVTSETYNLGEKFYATIVEKLNGALGADYTFLGKLINENKIETISLYGDGKILKNFSYALEDTPCENVVGNQVCSYPKDITRLFPKDILLQDMGIEGYVGVPVFNSKVESIGILVSLFKKPIVDSEIAESVLMIFASRAGAEMEHQEIYKKLEQKEFELKNQNEEYLAINEELNESFSQLKKINEKLKVATEKAKANEDKIQLLFEHSGTSNAFFSLDGKLLFQNSLSAKYLGGKPGDFDGKSFEEIFGPEQGKIILERVRKVCETKESKTFETPFDLPNGKKWFQTIYQPVFSKEDILSGIQLISKDISNEKEAEIKLKESEKNYSTLVETSTDLITRVDKNGKFLFVNHAAIDIFGLKPEECIGLSAFDFIHPEDKEKTAQKFTKWLKSNESQIIFENRQMHKNGTSRPMFWNIKANRNKNGALIDFTSIARDISKLKKLEEDLKEAIYKATESDRLKTAFLANISHEIRTPLNGMLGFVSLLCREDLPKEKRESYTNIVRTSSEQLLTTINDIIDFSEIEAGELIINSSVFSMHDLLKDLSIQTKMLLNRKEKHHIKVNTSINTNIDLVKTDRKRVNQVLLNLLYNAIKFTDKGEITIGLKNSNPDMLKLYVKDTGKGIDKSKHELIFEKFAKADTKDSFKGGTGLGLSICQLIANRMNGILTVKSELGKGATFEFEVPYEKFDS